MKHLKLFENFNEESNEMPDLSNFDLLRNEIQDFLNSYQYGKAFAKRDKFGPNFYSVEFKLPTGGRGEVISMGGKLTATGQAKEDAKKDAIAYAKAIESEIKSELSHIEDSSIDSSGNTVVLFMVSDDFKDSRWDAPITNKLR
jgi:hypothetical protein